MKAIVKNEVNVVSSFEWECAFTSGLHCCRVQNGPATAIGYATMTGKLFLAISKLLHLATSQYGTLTERAVSPFPL